MDFKSKQTIFAVAIAIIFIASAFFVGLYVGSENDNGQRNIIFADNGVLPPVTVDTSPLWKAWNALNERYVPATTTDIVSEQDRLWGAIQGLTNSLGDPYTVFMPPEDAEIFEGDINGNFGGVGMEIGMRDSILTVIAPLKGTPAFRAGIQSGDKIVEIDGEFTDDLTVDGAVKLIRGEVGTLVTLTIARNGEDEFLEIEIIRDRIEIPTIDTELREDGIFVIQLYNFSAISMNLFREALREFILSGAHKLILDLRGNPGGFLEAANDMTSWFLPTGKIIVTEDFGGNEKPRVHRSKGYDIFNENLKMMVLVDRGSASASEILAGALQQHGIAKLVGGNTFGKGSVQELVKITPETALKITIARWLTPNGSSISDGGLTPDFEVEFTKEDFEAGIDPQMDKAVELLLVD